MSAAITDLDASHFNGGQAGNPLSGEQDSLVLRRGHTNTHCNTAVVLGCSSSSFVLQSDSSLEESCLLTTSENISVILAHGWDGLPGSCAALGPWPMLPAATAPRSTEAPELSEQRESCRSRSVRAAACRQPRRLAPRQLARARLGRLDRARAVDPGRGLLLRAVVSRQSSVIARPHCVELAAVVVLHAAAGAAGVAAVRPHTTTTGHCIVL